MLRKLNRYVVLVTTQGDTPILRIPLAELAPAENLASQERARWSPAYKVTLLIIH